MNKIRLKLRMLGGVYIEAIFILPVIMGVVIFLFDVCRYIALTGLLNYSAYKTADYFAKLDIDVYIDSISCARNTESQQNCTKYNQRIDAALSKGNRIITSIAKPASTGGYTTFTSFQMYNSADYILPPISGLIPAKTSSVALIRPGEVARRLSNNTFFDHPTRPATSRGGPGWPQGFEGNDWKLIYLQHPIVARAEACMRLFTPIFGPWCVNATQTAYRRIHPIGISQLPYRANPLTPEPIITPIATFTQRPPDPTAPPYPTPRPTEPILLTPAPCNELGCNEPCDCDFNYCVQRNCVPSCPPCND